MSLYDIVWLDFCKMFETSLLPVILCIVRPMTAWIGALSFVINGSHSQANALILFTIALEEVSA